MVSSAEGAEEEEREKKNENDLTLSGNISRWEPGDLAKGNDSWKTGKVKWDRFSMIFNKRR